MTKALFKSSVGALALLVSAASFAPPAEAGRRGAGVAAGVIGGLAAGAIIGGALSRDRYYYDDPYVDPYYDDTYYAPPPRRVYVVPAPVDYGPPPGSGDWYAYCASKYRSFNARTGTYITYDGYERPCR